LPCDRRAAAAACEGSRGRPAHLIENARHDAGEAHQLPAPRALRCLIGLLPHEPFEIDAQQNASPWNRDSSHPRVISERRRSA
jgi:hypothetical protein